jgi:hypothetical protein
MLKCLCNLYKNCRVIDILMNVDKEKFSEAVALYGKPEFLRVYCSFCIKALYAKRFKIVKYSVVNTL